MHTPLDVVNDWQVQLGPEIFTEKDGLAFYATLLEELRRALGTRISISAAIAPTYHAIPPQGAQNPEDFPVEEANFVHFQCYTYLLQQHPQARVFDQLIAMLYPKNPLNIYCGWRESDPPNGFCRNNNGIPYLEDEDFVNFYDEATSLYNGESLYLLDCSVSVLHSLIS